MSVNTFVVLLPANLPSLEKLQAALTSVSPTLKLDPVDDLATHDGFWPGRFDKTPAGFEWSYGTIEEVFGEDVDDLGDRTHAVCFTTHSDMTELASALFVAAALASISDGLIFDESSYEFGSVEDTLAAAQEVFEEVCGSN